MKGLSARETEQGHGHVPQPLDHPAVRSCSALAGGGLALPAPAGSSRIPGESRAVGRAVLDHPHLRAAQAAPARLLDIVEVPPMKGGTARFTLSTQALEQQTVARWSRLDSEAETLGIQRVD